MPYPGLDLGLGCFFGESGFFAQLFFVEKADFHAISTDAKFRGVHGHVSRRNSENHN